MSDEAGAAGEGGPSGDRGWLSSIPENLREHEAFTGAESLSSVYQGFADLTVANKEMLAIPGEDATDEDRAAFHAKLGRPEAADQYQLDKPELPADIPYDDTIESAFKQLAFDKGLSQQTASELHQWYWGTVKAGSEQQQKSTEEALNTLKDEWKGDAFKTNSELAVRAFSKFGGDEAKKFIEEAQVNGVSLGNHPVFLRVFAEVGKKISDDTMTGDRGGNLDAISSDEEQAKKRFPNTKF